MALVTFKDLCLDVNDLVVARDFWAPVLGLDVRVDEDDEPYLVGPTPHHTVWPCQVPEPHTVKNRVHLDVRSTVEVPEGAARRSEPGRHPWTILVDPEGNELCAFTYDEVPEYRLKDVVVDAVDHVAISRWWAEVWGGTLVHDDEGYSYLDDVPGVPFGSFDFVPVPEPKTVKNRVHWDVTLLPGSTVADLERAGATVLREPVGQDRWTVMADPEGNEFCVFEP